MQADILAGRIRVLMYKQGLTYRELAAKSGISPNILSGLSKGRVGSKTAYSTFERIAQVLGITVAQLVGDAPLDVSVHAPAEPVTSRGYIVNNQTSRKPKSSLYRNPILNGPLSGALATAG